MKVRLIAIAAAGAVLGLFFTPGHAGRVPNRPPALSEREMGELVGGDGCFNCHAAGTRLDECYHQGYVDPCLSDKCIANYLIEDSCDLGQGTCTAQQLLEQPSAVQYARADSGCATNNPRTWTVWVTHYYGSGCATYAPKTRCQKSSGSCDGALIDTGTRYPGIRCSQ